jgi:DNA invertase Pin-like site-specific DNA recombinase
MRLVAYLRTSTNGANDDSLVAQEEACRTWAGANGHEVIELRSDQGLSGSRPVDERPGLAAALLAIEEDDHPAEGLIVQNLDRLARQLHVQEAALARVWQASGSAFETCDGEVRSDDPDDPQRTFLRQVLGAAAQLERGMIAARLRRGRRRKRERGGYSGGWTVPLGYRVEGEGRVAQLVPDPDDEPVIERIIELRQSGKTLAEVADRLNVEGAPTKRGGNWHAASVRRVLIRHGTRPAVA